jgi:hypothetical protein
MPVSVACFAGLFAALERGRVSKDELAVSHSQLNSSPFGSTMAMVYSWAIRIAYIQVGENEDILYTGTRGNAKRQETIGALNFACV